MTRIGPSVLLLRGFVVAVGFGALALAVPSDVQGLVAYGIALALAVPPAVRPDSWFVLAVELLAVAGWLVRTVGFAEPVSWIALLALASTLYLHHVGCAMAAALPLDVVVDPRVWLRPAVRALAALAATGLLGAAALVLAGRVVSVSTVVVPVLGVLLSIALVWVVHSRRSG
jgi:hypothetical protein